MKNIIKSFTIIIFLFLNLCIYAQDSQWRGENRDGIYNDKGLLQEWPKKGPERIFLLEDLGSGYSSPIVKNEIIYISGRRDSIEVLTAVNMDGDILWETLIGEAWLRSYPDSRCSPTIENDRIYISSSTGNVNCLDLKTGEVIWAVNTHDNHKAVFGRFGMAESVLLTETAVISTPAGAKTALVALDKKDGSLIWKTKSMGDVRAYVSPLLIEHNGTKFIIAITSDNVLSVNPDNGKVYWNYNIKEVHAKDVRNNNTNTPLFHNGEIFVTRGYDAEAVMLKLSDDGKSVSLKWASKELDSHHGGVVLLDGYLYGANWINSGNGNWICQKWDNGKVMWEKTWFNRGSVIYADNRLYIFDEKYGNVGLVEPNPKKFKLKGTFKIEEGNGPHWAHPTIYNGYLLLRHGKALMVYDIKKNRN